MRLVCLIMIFLVAACAPSTSTCVPAKNENDKTRREPPPVLPKPGLAEDGGELHIRMINICKSRAEYKNALEAEAIKKRAKDLPVGWRMYCLGVRTELKARNFSDMPTEDQIFVGSAPIGDALHGTFKRGDYIERLLDIIATGAEGWSDACGQLGKQLITSLDVAPDGIRTNFKPPLRK